MNEFILNEEIYHRVIQTELPAAKSWIWIATADIKDLHVDRGKKRYVPFLQVLAELVREGVEVRLIHAKEPGPRFRKDFDRFPELVESQRFDRLLCPRMHMKTIVIDGKVAFIGSANLTGAGMGAKSPLRRNFESGFISRDPAVIDRAMEFLDQLWIGDHCIKCGRRDYCPDPVV